MTSRQKYTPWRNLLGATLLLAATVGLNGTGLTLFYEPVAQHLGFTQVQFSLYYTFSCLAAMILSPFIGKVFTKYPGKMKLILFLSLLIHTLCILGYAVSSSLLVFYLVSIVRGAAFAFASGIPATLIVNSWFEDRRSTAQSILFIGPCVGSISFMYLSRIFIDAFSWREAYGALAAVNLLLMALILPLATPAPDKMGLTPYRTSDHGENPAPAPAGTGFAFRDVVRMPSFWFFCVGVFLANVLSFGVMQYLGPMLMSDCGWSSVTTSNLIMVFNVFGSGVSALCGWLADRRGTLKVMSALAILQIVAYLMMPGCGNFTVVVLFVLVFAIGSRLSSVFLNSVIPDIFGMKEYGSIYGMTSFFLMGGMSLGPLMIGAIYDTTGSYIPMYIAGVVITLLFVPMTFIPLYRRTHGRMPFPEEAGEAEIS